MTIEHKMIKALKEMMDSKGYAFRTKQLYIETIKEYISFHGKRDPRYMGMIEIDLFMDYLVRSRKIQANLKQKIFQILIFFYTQVLEISLQDEYIEASRISQALLSSNKTMVQSVMYF